MKITKYPQSCFMVKTCGKNILVDPGSISYDPSFAVDWAKADFILITHKHGDHCHAEILKDFSAPIYSSAEVAAAYPELKITKVKVGQELALADGINVSVVNAVHGYLPHLRGDKEIHENIGFILNAEGKKIYFTSDSVCFKNDYKCDILCVGINEHGLSMTPAAAARFAKECGAGLVLPCHLDNPVFPVDIPRMENTLKENEINYRILKTKETI